MTSSRFQPTLPHRLWRLLPAIGRRRVGTAVAALLAPRIDREPPPAMAGIAVAGELTRFSGLGEGARLMARGLDALGVANWPVDVSALLPAGASGTDPDVSAVPPPGMPLVIHVNAPSLPILLLRLPRAFAKGRRVIGFWAWELPDVPPDWRAGTQFVHEVWVPSSFTAAAIEPLLPGRVRVVPFPLAIAPPIPGTEDRRAFGLPETAVVVLVSFNLASSFVRKNPMGAIAAFRAAFGDRPDRILVLKIGNPEHFPADFARITDAVADAPNIRIDTNPYPAATTHALTAAADIVLSLHRAEGFGLVLAEAMLLAKPVIATGWSGNMTFMDQDSAALVDYRFVAVNDPRQVYRNSTWAEPDQGQAISHLRHLADNAETRAALGARAKVHAQAKLTVEPLAAAIRSLGIPIPQQSVPERNRST